jgi:chromosome segregation and condensation protein ScpB
MMSETQSSVTSGLPLVLPTNAKQPFAKLLVRNEQGQIVQQWLLSQNKCTLGSASACALRCQLPGIAAYHALLVIGAKQVFIRGLSPKLTRNGIASNELLLSESENTFEIAGHRFELVRNIPQDSKTANTSAAVNSRIKFALARPLDLGQRRYEDPTQRSQPKTVAPAISPPVTTNNLPPGNFPVRISGQYEATQSATARNNFSQSDSLTSDRDRNSVQPTGRPDSSWINEIVQNAIQPIEQQFQNLLAPLVEAQAKSALQSLTRRKAKSRRKKATSGSIAESSAELTLESNLEPRAKAAQESTANEQPTPQSAANVTPTVAFDSQTIVRSFEFSLQALSALDQDSIVVLSPQLDDIHAEDETQRDSLRSTPSPEISNSVVVPVNGAAPVGVEAPEAIQASISVDEPKLSAALEAMIGRQFASLEVLSERLSDVSSQLGALERIVTENLSARPVPSDVESKSSASDEAITRLTAVTERLNELMLDLQNRQVALESTDHNWRESLDGKLAQLQQRIETAEDSRAAAVPSASEEALQRIATVTERLSALMEELQSRQATLENSDQQWRTRLLDQMNQLQERITSTELTVQSLSQLPQTASTAKLSESFKPKIQTPAVLPAIEPSGAVADYSVAFVTEDISEIPEWQGETPSASVEEFIDESNIGNASDERLNPWSRDQAVTPRDRQDCDSTFAQSTAEQSNAKQTPAVPAAQNNSGPQLPAWWTDDDKSQYADDVSYSAQLASQLINPVAPYLSAPAEPAYNDKLSEWELPALYSEPSSFSSPSSSSSEPMVFDDLSGSSSIDEKNHLSSPVDWQVPPATAFSPAESTNEEVSSRAVLDKTEAQELAAILEKFGVAAPESRSAIEPAGAQEKPLQLPLGAAWHTASAGLTNTKQPDADSVDCANEPQLLGAEDIVDEQTEESELKSQQVQASEPKSGPAAEASDAAAEDEEESIEDYMKRLMARMRGDSEGTTAEPKEIAPRNPEPVRDTSSVKLPARKTESYQPAGKTTGPATTRSIKTDEYTPKLAPEKSTTMAAMRELANNSARSAIQVSTRRRHGTALVIKIAVASTGFIAGIALIMMNGLNVNIALIATFACFLVALIWGFDAANTLKPLFAESESTVPPVPVAVEENVASEENIG